MIWTWPYWPMMMLWSLNSLNPSWLGPIYLWWQHLGVTYTNRPTHTSWHIDPYLDPLMTASNPWPYSSDTYLGHTTLKHTFSSSNNPTQTLEHWQYYIQMTHPGVTVSLTHLDLGIITTHVLHWLLLTHLLNPLWPSDTAHTLTHRPSDSGIYRTFSRTIWSYQTM